MRWKVLFVRPWAKSVEPALAALRRVGVDPMHELVDTEPALVAALTRDEWDVVIYDGDGAKDIPLELVYTHAPAAAIVVWTSLDDVADELARVAATRVEIEEP